jgi:hypothetical protein
LKSLASLVFFVPLMAALTGCISYSRQPFDPSANASIKKIAVLPVTEPREMRVVNLGGVGGSFGLLGMAIDAAEQERKTGEFMRVMTGQQVTVGKHLTRTIEAELKKQGYVVTVLSSRYGVIDPGAPADEEVDYSRIDTDADAILHVWFGAVGYISPPTSMDYTPQMWAAARLVHAKIKSQLYFQSFAYQNINATAEAIHDITPPGYAYRDFDLLMARSSEAAQGLKTGAGEIGARIANDLSKSDQPAMSSPAIAAGSPPALAAGSSPESAAGFSLGSDAAAAEARCTGASFVWQKVNDRQFSCSGAPADVGVPATVTLTTCSGVVCKVAVNGSVDSAAWSALVERFGALSARLEGSLGKKVERETKPLKDCTDGVPACFAAGRVRRSTTWRWSDNNSVSLVLWGGQVGGAPELRIYYYTAAYTKGGA